LFRPVTQFMVLMHVDALPISRNLGPAIWHIG
jgi:hypothetical protein